MRRLATCSTSSSLISLLRNGARWTPRCSEQRSRVLHRTSERCHARFVHAGDVADARLPQDALEVAHGVLPQPLVAGAIESLLQGLAELLHACARVALEPREHLGAHRLAILDVALADFLDR